MTNRCVVGSGNAGERGNGTKPDEWRPLTRSGRSQAEGPVAVLAEAEIVRILSSPYVRCVETVEPAAAQRGLDVVPSRLLAVRAGDRAPAQPWVGR